MPWENISNGGANVPYINIKSSFLHQSLQLIYTGRAFFVSNDCFVLLNWGRTGKDMLCIIIEESRT